uniref:ATP synthase subunit b n=1 Tax=Acrobeloides nanus TaxID=290746 RepID=A0A914ED01_9BILA
MLAPKANITRVSNRDFGKFLLPMPKEAKMKNIVKMVYNMVKGMMGLEHKTNEQLTAERKAKEAKEKLEGLETKEPNKIFAWLDGYQQKVAARFNGTPIPGEKHSPESLLTTIYGTNFGKIYTPPDFTFPEMPKDYKEHPERDLVKFPYPVMVPFPPKHRLTVFPETWFRALEPITGTSGGYLLAFGVLSVLVSKEFLIWPMVGLAQTWFVWFAIALFLLRYRIQQQVYTNGMNYFAKHRKIIEDDLQMVQNFNKLQTARLDSLMTTKDEFPLVLQEKLNNRFMHSNYRNMETLRKELKRHLDFLRDSELEKQRLERSIFVSSIIQEVKKQIESNVDGIKDKYLDNCIEQLRTLASRPSPLG